MYKLTSEADNFINENYNDGDRVRALLAHLERESFEDVEETGTGVYGYGLSFDVDGSTYAVLTDDEADLAAHAALDSYISDSGMLDGMPESLRGYFDQDAWKRDALLSDGRSHVLATYDGEEGEQQIDGVWYYIYRTN